MIPESPYKGLVPFEDSDLDALLFFGRERESGIISENVLAARLTVLYGPSGVGKTSVLRAGVAHHLRREAQRNVDERGHPEFVVVIFDAWSEDPVGSLRTAVRDELASQFGSALLDEREGESLADTFGRWTEGFACDLLLILDQAEEYFLYHHGESGFAVELPGLVTRPGLRVRVLLSLREDALAKLDRFKGRIPNLFANYLRLDHLDRRAAGEAVVKPVERYNELTGDSVEVEPELVDAVLDETAAGQVDFGATGRGIALEEEEAAGRIEAAYLQLVLERLWEDERAAGSTRLRVTTLAALGGAESIVRAHLRRAVEGLSTEERDVAADVFRFLVTPSGTKIAHGASDLAEYAAVDEQRVLPVLSTLGRERILRTVDGAGANGARYEIFHDVLGEAVLAWRREQELERERRAAERRHRRLGMVTAAALLGLAAMTAVAIYAFSQRSEARENARAARASARSARARELGALALSDLATDPREGVRRALQAARLEPTQGAEDVLRTALIDSRVRGIFRAGRGPVNAAAYSPDGSLVVTASEDGTARVFRVRDGSRIATLRHEGGVTDAAFSDDGRLIATSSRDRTARVWATSGRRIREFRHGGAVLDLAFTPGAKSLVTLADDATLHVFSLSGPRTPLVFHDVPGNRLVLSRDGLRAAVVNADRYARVYSLESERHLTDLPHQGRVRAAAFGPSSNVLATGSADKLAFVWTLVTFRPADTLRGHQGQVVDVAVGPLGQFLATASLDGTADIWNIAGPGHLAATLSGHSNFVNDVDFSPDGLYVVTSSRDGTARVWKTKGGILQAVLAGHQGPVQAASFSPTGSSVLTYSGDGTARIWDAGTTLELRPLSRDLQFGRTLDLSGSRALTSGRDGTARIWNLRGGRSTMLRHSGPVRDAAFSPNGRLVVTASADHTAGIWTSSGARRQTLRHPGAVNTAAFSPDSRLVATAGADGRVRIWDAKSRRQVATLTGRSPVECVAFDPTRDLLATAGRDRVVRLWSTRSWQPERILRGHRGRVVALSFSHDGNLLLTGSKDATGRIWNVDTGRSVTLTGHHDALTSARFSPDDRLVATASVDHDVRLWNTRTGTLARPVLRAHFGIVSDARFSDDGRWLVSAGPGSAGLWQVRTHKLVALLRGRPFGARGPTGRGSIGILYAAGFSPGSFRVVTAGQDGTVRTYLCRICADIHGLEKLAEEHLAEVAGTG